MKKKKLEKRVATCARIGLSQYWFVKKRDFLETVECTIKATLKLKQEFSTMTIHVKPCEWNGDEFVIIYVSDNEWSEELIMDLLDEAVKRNEV